LSQEPLAELFTAIVDSALDAVVVCDEAQNVVLLNAAAEQVFGWSSSEVVGGPLSRFVPEHFRVRYEGLVRGFGASGASRRAPAEFSPVIGLSASGEEIPLEASIASVEVGGRKYFAVLHRDVRKRLSADAAVQASERRFRGLFESLLEGYAYCRMEFDEGRAVDYVHLEVNPAFEAPTGLRGALGRRVTELIPGIRDDNPELFEIYGRVVATGEPAKFETFVPGLDRWYSIAAFRPEEGCFAVVFENVTEAKRSLLALRESERFANAVLDGLAANIAVVDGQGRILAINQAWRLFGETNGLSVEGDPAAYGNYLEVCDRAAASGCAAGAEFAAGLRSVLAGERGSFTLEYDCHSPEAERWFSARVTPFAATGPRRAVVAHEEVTQRVLSDRALQHAQAIGQTGSWSADLVTHRFETSPEGARLVGWASGSHRIEDVPRLVHPDDGGRVRDAWVAARAGRAPFDVEVRVVVGGAVRWLHVLAEFERNARNWATRATGFAQDITERKAAEEILRLQAAALAASENAIVITDRQARIQWANPAFTRLTGYSLDEALGLNPRELVRSGVQSAEFYRALWETILSGGTWKGEIVNRRRDGEFYHEELAITPVADETGGIRYFVAVKQDITDRKAGEKALRSSEERLRLFFEQAPVALAMFDREMRYLSASRRWRSDFELGDGELAGRLHYEVSPDVRDDWKEAHRRGLAGEVVRCDEDRFVRGDGNVQWLRWEVQPWRDLAGEVAGIVIFSGDITERKRTLEALAESEGHYRALAETTFDWIWEIDRRARFTFASQRVTEHLGYAPEEVLGRTPFDFMAADEARRVRAIYEALAERQEPFVAIETISRRKDGRLVMLESSGVPRFGSDGVFRGFRGVNRDVTARKQAERRAATQAAVARVLAESARLSDAAAGVLEAIGQSEGWDFGALWEIDRDGEELRRVARWASDGRAAERLIEETRGLALRRGEGLPGRVWEAGGFVSSQILEGDTDFRRESGEPGENLQSGVGFPIRLETGIIGVVVFLGRAIHEPEPGLVEMFEAIGRQLGLFVERARAAEAVARFVSGSPAVIYAMRIEPDGLKLAWHGGNLEAISGWHPEQIRGSGWWVDNIHPDDRERVLAANPVPYEIDHQILEFRFRRPDGSYTWVRDEKRLLRDTQGRPTEIVGSWTDVTDRVQLEEQLRVSQKLEAVGRLAGGVAHDFNNILTVIAGNSELLAKSLAPTGGDQLLLGEVRDASERAATLTRQLLAFSRSQVLAPQILELNRVVTRVEGMLRRLIGEDIALACDLAPETGFVQVDPGQIEQVIINLAVNARDAMPRGGRLTIESHAVELDADYCRRHPEVPPGRYALLAVSDTGTGMTPEVRARIFEPFFTTKGPGKGSGLGLATVFGIVKQSGGQIEVRSDVGTGTCFEVYLPQVAAPAETERQVASTGAPVRGHETILLVEDEEGVRKIARLALESHGYKVLGATDGRAAAAVAEAQGEAIDLLVTDLVMPEMSGRELADLLRARRPDLKVLFMSGYVEDALVRHGLVQAEEAFLHKPFSLGELAARVRDLLDSAPKPSA